MPDASPTGSTSTVSEGWTEFEGPSGTTKYVKVVLVTSYANGTATGPSTTFTAPIVTGTGHVDSTHTEEQSAPLGNGTTTTQHFPTVSLGTAVSTTEEPTAPFGNGTTTTQHFPTASMGTGVTTISEPSAPFGNGTSSTVFAPTGTGSVTPSPSGPCAGLEGSSYRDENGVEYEVRSAADSSINSYNGTDRSTIQECFKACDEQFQCKGFTYVTSGFAAGICYLKSEVGDFVTSENTRNMCSAFRTTPAANTTTTFSASGSVVPTPETSSAPFQNSTTSAPVTGPIGTATSSSRRCAFVCPDYIDACGQYYGPGCYTSCPGVPGPSFTTPLCSGTTSAAVSSTVSTISASVTTPVRPVNGTSTASTSEEVTPLPSPVETSSTTPQSERTMVSTQTVTSVETQVQTLSQQNGTTTIVQTSVHTSEIPHTITIDRPVPFTTVATHNQTFTLTTTKGDETIVKTVELPVPTTKTVTPAAHTEVTTVDRPVPFTTVATHNQTVTLTTTKGDKTIVKTVQSPVPTTKTVTPKAPVSHRTKTTTVTRTLTRPCTKKGCQESSTTFVARYNTTVVDAITASCSTIPAAYVTKISTIKTTLSKPRQVTTTECVETYTLPESTTWIWEPETSCNGTSTTLSKPVNSTTQHTTSTIFATSTATVTQGNLTSLITTSVVASTTVVPIPTTPVAPVTASASTTLATSPAAPVSQASTPGSSPVAPFSQPSAPGSSPVAPVSQHSTPGSSPVSPVSQTSVDSVVSQPSAPGSSPVAPVSPESSAPASTPVSPVSPESPVVYYSVASQPSAPGSSPVSPETPDTTLETRVGTTLTSSAPVTVTATRPSESPVSPVQPSAPESSPVSPEQPSVVPSAPESSPETTPATIPVSPEQPSSSAYSPPVVIGTLTESQSVYESAPTKTGKHTLAETSPLEKTNANVPSSSTGSVPTESVTGGASATCVSVFAGLVAVAAVMLAL